ncbi:CHRD domain-containing protein [Ornithinimicrobium sediminis]|jgi:hypothetical protein|uniref:CHRD domain-containing protein n=1 Tax=Ornithinimicrobium sediminis TaxID=2904603 RepID=UPI001E5A5769|nr:CHRD domain-containing protein [Ornithinimicrobium sediminis]MCE0487922.1 CHRD domain-containing protein [Ornithinimicrobium sediminis]
MRTVTTRLTPVAIAALVGLPIALAAPATASDHESGTELSATLTEISGSGASGTAWGWVDGTELTIQIEAMGLLDGAPHAQHIHIGGSNTCPSADLAGSGFEGAVRTTDAVDFYGGVAVSLTNEGGMTGPDHALDVMDFPAEGEYSYERTFEVPQDVADDIAAGNGVVVVHGVDHNGSGEYDGDQESDLDPSLPSEATDPAMCGTLDVAQMAMPEDGVATGGGATQGTEHAGAIALGAVAIGAGALGLAASRRRTETARR